MKKKHIIRLSDEERTILRSVINNGEGSAFRIRRAQILLHADVDGANWSSKRISEAFGCDIATVINVRKSFMTKGFDLALNGKQTGWVLLDSNQEAKIIALLQGSLPGESKKWTLRLVAKQAIELGVVDSISHETIRKTLRKYSSPMIV